MSTWMDENHKKKRVKLKKKHIKHQLKKEEGGN